MSALWQYVVSGVSNGCVYALIALGFVLIANVTQVYNFAQGQYVMVGGMILVACEKDGMPVVLAVVLAVLATSGVALAQERLTVAPIRKHTSLLGLVVIALGFGTLLQGAALLIWGQYPLSVPSFEPGTFHLFGAALDNQTFWIWGATVAALALIVVLFRRTTTGRAMRACAMNPVAARLSGIRSERMSIAAFVLGGALTGLVGAVVVPLSSVSWDSGVTIGLVGFIAAAVAGFSNPVTAVLAGLALGIIESVAAGEISASYNEAIVYAVLLLYLLGRDLSGPDGVVVRVLRGLSGRRGKRQRRRPLLPSAARPATVRPSVRAARRITPRNLVPVVLVGLLILVPFVFSSTGTAMSSATLILLGAIGATGLVLVMGLAGQFSLGQAAFYLLSGYVVAILTTKHGWNPVAALAMGAFVAIVGGLIIGWLTLRLQGFNLAIATLAFHLIFLVLAANWVSETGGPQGIIGVPFLTIFGINFSDPKAFFWLALGVLMVCLVIARNLTASPMGRALRAIGAEEAGAESLGVNAFRLKLIVFVIAAGMAGIAGGLWAYYIQFAVSTNWDFSLTISLITYVVVGGITSPYGGLVGALVVGTLQYYVQYHTTTAGSNSSSNWQVVMNGAFLVVFLLLFRNGLVPVLSVDAMKRRFVRLRGGSPPEPTTGGPRAEPPPVASLAVGQSDDSREDRLA